MALTGGLLTFLAVEALAEALELQAVLPGALGGTGPRLLGVAASYLALTFLARSGLAPGRERGGPSAGSRSRRSWPSASACTTSARGLRSGRRFALVELTLGTFLIVGFMVHNVTEGLGIAAPAGEGLGVGVGRLAALALIAGAPDDPRRLDRWVRPSDVLASSSSPWRQAPRFRSSSRYGASSRGGPRGLTSMRRRFPRGPGVSCATGPARRVGTAYEPAGITRGG